MDGISDVAHRLKALRLEAGLSARQLAQAIGDSENSYQHYENRYKRPYQPVDLMQRVAPVLARHGIDPARVLELAGTTPEAVGMRAASPAAPSSAALVRAPSAVSAPQPAAFDRTDRLPVFGSAQAGPDGQTIGSEPVEWIDRPEALRGVLRAFAVYVMNDSMEPRYEQGDMLYIHPHRAPRRNCHVVIRKTDDTAVVKRFVRDEPDRLIVRQYNPPAEYAIAKSDVKEIFVVIGAMDGR